MMEGKRMGLDKIVLWLLIGYTIIPFIYSRYLSKKVIHRLPTLGLKNIALTFDDGPDEKYTPLVLDLLAEQHIKASFFFVSDKVNDNPNLIERVKREGHDIGFHSLKHRCAWFSTVKQTLEDFKCSFKIFSKLNLHLRYYRPPWGIFNLLTLPLAKQNKLKIILWSVDSQDWSHLSHVDGIVKRVTSVLKDGDIVLLHDGRGYKDEDAPYRTLRALREIIPQMKERGYRFVSLSEGLSYHHDQKNHSNYRSISG